MSTVAVSGLSSDRTRRPGHVLLIPPAQGVPGETVVVGSTVGRSPSATVTPAIVLSGRSGHSGAPLMYTHPPPSPVPAQAPVPSPPPSWFTLQIGRASCRE